MGLQRSKYLSIVEDICQSNVYEGTLSKQFKEVKIERGSESLRWDPLTAAPLAQTAGAERIDLPLQFNPAAEVAKKAQHYLRVKAQFYIRMNHLKSIGQQVDTLGRTYGFIQKNIDAFYKDDNLRKKMLGNCKPNRKNMTAIV